VSEARPPITREPRRLRPPYDQPDTTFDDLMTSEPDAWQRAVRLDRLAGLVEPLAGLDITEYEHGRLEYLADALELHVVAVLAALLWRAREAAQRWTAPACPRCGLSDVADLGGYLEYRGCGYGWTSDPPAADEPGRPPFEGSHPVRVRLVQDVLVLLAAHGYRRPPGAASLVDTLRALNSMVEAFEGGR
jgi:hypothetical protein